MQRLFPTPVTRRMAVTAIAAVALAGCASRPAPEPAPDPFPPIVFVHGDGDNASVWTTTIWRFESNGWPRERLVAVDLAYPTARDDDAVPQPGRSSGAEQRAALSAGIDRVLTATGARRVVLMGLSRGGNAIRSVVADGGAARVSHAILGGTPSHGVWAFTSRSPGSEFNGTGPFLRALNAPKGPNGDEVTPGVRWLTIRSDSADKYAQPDAAVLGLAGTPTGVGFDGPALKGAQNIVVAGADHRETALGARAFEQAFRFLTGRAPATLAITPEAAVVLDGNVTAFGFGNDPAKGSAASNLPLVGATVEVYATDAATGERLGSPLLRRTIGADGRWGPLATDSTTTLEFVIVAAGYATTHVYRSVFPRSSNVVHLRPERFADADRDAKAVVVLSRPRGYFGIPRDLITLDGLSPPAGIPAGVPVASTAKAHLPDATGRAVTGEFNGERIVGRAWPALDRHVTVLELTY